MVSRTLTVRSSSPQISQAFTTVLNTDSGGFSALPSLESWTCYKVNDKKIMEARC